MNNAGDTLSDNLLGDAAERLFVQTCTPALLRAAEQGQPIDAAWRACEDAGFTDALVPESLGGAGLPLAAALPVVLAAGRHLCPYPIAHTMLARGWLAAHGHACPAGPIALAPHGLSVADHRIAGTNVPWIRVASHVLAQIDGQAWLLPVQAADVQSNGIHGSLDGEASWALADAQCLGPIRASDEQNGREGREGRLGRNGHDGRDGQDGRHGQDGPDGHNGQRAADTPDALALLAATAYAGLMAGAMERVLAMTLDYANTRAQFGKSIGRFQAVQQQISVMAEEVWAANMAAQLAFQSQDTQPGNLPRVMAGALPNAMPGATPGSIPSAMPAATPGAMPGAMPSATPGATPGAMPGVIPSVMPGAMQAAVGKARVSQAAPRVADIAHAVHGAIGVTAEFDLQLYTRRLRDWRLAAGSESFWHAHIGAHALQGEDSALDLIRRVSQGQA